MQQNSLLDKLPSLHGDHMVILEINESIKGNKTSSNQLNSI